LASTHAAELLAATGDVAKAIGLATTAIEVEPWSEPAHRAVIGAHRAAALRAFEACEQALTDFGGIAEPETQMLARRISS